MDERMVRAQELVDAGKTVSAVAVELGATVLEVGSFIRPSKRRLVERHKRAVAMKERGLSTREIANALGVSMATALNALRTRPALEVRLARARKMAAMRDAGFTNREIAAAVGYSVGTVNRILGRAWPFVREPRPVGRPGRKPVPDERRARIEALLAEGLSLRKVAAEVGVSHTTVRRVRDRGGA